MQAKIIQLGVESKNAQALGLYETFGFVTWGIEPMAMKVEGEFLTEHMMAYVI
ncbi:MAG: hypothetical protein KBD78_09575 [Oligoflexales bacterium]|nr:hypothetical protein [Oligoflexales bacterium]